MHNEKQRIFDNLTSYLTQFYLSDPFTVFLPSIAVGATVHI